MVTKSEIAIFQKNKVVPPFYKALVKISIFIGVPNKGFFVLIGEVNNMANYDDFVKLDIRVGEIIEVEDFPEARKPAYILSINFGKEIGIKKSSAQLVKYYQKEELKGKKVLGVVNFPVKQIGPFMSEALTLGVPDDEHECVLVVPDNDKAVVGGKLY